MRKKFIAKILVLCMVLSMMAVPANAISAPATLTNIDWEQDNAYTLNTNTTLVAYEIKDSATYTIDMASCNLDGSVTISKGKLQVKDTAYNVSSSAELNLNVSLAGGSFAYCIDESAYVVRGDTFKVVAAKGYKLGDWTTTGSYAVVSSSVKSSGGGTVSGGGGTPATTPTTTTSATVNATSAGKVEANALKVAMDKPETDAVTIKTTEGEIVLPDAVVAELLKVVGSDVTVELKTTSTNSALNDAQKNSVDGLAVGLVVSIKLISNGSEVKNFNGKITVTVPYTAPEGQKAEDTVVYYVDDEGNLTAMETSYADGKLSYVTTHNSEYVAIYEPFKDARTTDWFAKYVQFVFDKGYMNGMGDGKFQPNTNLSRAMMVTTLYRIKGASGGNPAVFTDVAEGQWFTEAINWAAATKIASGMGDGTFAPNTDMTREQMAQFLYNYAKANGMDTTVTGDLSQFADASAVSGWAQDAMKWAVGTGLINGMDGKLNPQGTATRAQVATVLTRFAQA